MKHGGNVIICGHQRSMNAYTLLLDFIAGECMFLFLISVPEAKEIVTNLILLRVVFFSFFLFEWFRVGEWFFIFPLLSVNFQLCFSIPMLFFPLTFKAAPSLLLHLSYALNPCLSASACISHIHSFHPYMKLYYITCRFSRCTQQDSGILAPLNSMSSK